MARPLLYTLTSGLHGEMAPDARQEPFIRGIEAALGMSFDCRGDDFSGYGAGDVPEIIYVRTGGTEGLFLEKVAPRLGRPVRLLTSGQSNSLAASMEILSWLRQHGFAGEILHGSAADIAARIRTLPDEPVSSPSPSPDFSPEAASSPNSSPAFSSGAASSPAPSPAFSPGAASSPAPSPAFSPGAASSPNSSPAFSSGAASSPAPSPDFSPEAASSPNSSPAFSSGAASSLAPSPAFSPASFPASSPGAEEGHFAPGRSKNSFLGAEEGHFAPGSTNNSFPGAEEGRFAPGGTENCLPGAEEGYFAPGSTDKGLPGAKESHFAPGSAEKSLPGVEPVGPETFGRILDGMRFGVIGKPSDWLISSNVDYAIVRENLGAELIDIPIEELIEEARCAGPETPPDPGHPCRNGEGSPEKAPISGPGIDLKSSNAPQYGCKIISRPSIDLKTLNTPQYDGGERSEEARCAGPETPPDPGHPCRNGEGSPEKAPISGPGIDLKSSNAPQYSSKIVPGPGVDLQSLNAPQYGSKIVPGPGIGLKPLNAPKFGRKIDAGDWQGALSIYAALRRLIDRYHLDGLTLRCFDLLTALHNTGCLALAILNAEGVTATCEGDIPAMLSMAVARARTGRASFQVNLSRIEGDRLLFAHCTVPLSLVRDYCYDTHFESGIGVAIHGELPEGPVTLFKLSPDCRRMFRQEARLVANTYGDALCRTQVVVEAPGAAAYFLHAPIGNHHIIVPGKL